MRLEQGQAHGFRRDGELFVYLNESAAERRFGGSTADPPVGEASAPAGDGSLPIVVEFQKVELTRLLKENDRLNTRLDQLMEEIRHLRDMQQREQVLRQQEQALRQQIQDGLDRLTSRLALPPPIKAPESSSPPAAASQPADSRPELVLTRMAPAAAATSAGAGTGARGPGHGRMPPGPAFLATRSRVDRREPRAAMPKAAPGAQPPPTLVAADPIPPAPAAAEDGAIAPEEAAELVSILNDIGQSLRDSEAFRRYPPIMPGSAPQRAGERRPAGPGLGASVKRPPAAAAAPRPAAPTPASKAPVVDERALLEILNSMGSSAEDRRNAARKMRQILRGRPPLRPR